MKLLKFPRAVVAAEYSLLRLPLTALHRGVLGPRLGPDSALLLGFERAVGTMDVAAGTLLADPELRRRGTVLARKAQAGGLARDLSDKADQRAESADKRAEADRLAELAAAEKTKRSAH